jgi:hypothetical protein
MNWLNNIWDKLFPPQEVTVYYVDWDKVKTIKDMVFICKRADLSAQIPVSKAAIEDTPHWKNLTKKRTYML